MDPVGSKFLPCVTLNLACRTQSRIVPSLHRLGAAICGKGAPSAMAAALADDDDDLALVVELRRNLRAHQRRAVADEGAQETDEHGRIFRRSLPSLYSSLRSG